ncbi:MULTISPECIES: c-type cytochrome [Flavobacterium]|uniref:c-type cytochrome n=1 Tax=Flavobacterium TaxID=237 RepID=UPI001FCBBACE|nr:MULTISPECIES: cytochrome c [Flavobacterium]UOK42636.1 cytochrome c [Flavobacterium enshiense]
MNKYLLGAVLGTIFSFSASAQDINKGKAVYNSNCVACHQAAGQGIPNAFPPLAKSDWLNKDHNRSIKQIIKGSSGPMTVNGKTYNGAMPPQSTLSDQQVADVLTYVYSNWGNNKKKVTPAMVKAQRKS